MGGVAVLFASAPPLLQEDIGHLQVPVPHGRDERRVAVHFVVLVYERGESPLLLLLLDEATDFRVNAVAASVAQNTEGTWTGGGRRGGGSGE